MLSDQIDSSLTLGKRMYPYPIYYGPLKRLYLLYHRTQTALLCSLKDETAPIAMDVI